MNRLSAPGDTVAANAIHDKGWIRLYVARGTPNSARAECNLKAALLRGQVDHGGLEIIDVFTASKRAIRDGVIVTPTLIACKAGRRQMLMGDLTEHAKLDLLLQMFAFLPGPSSASVDR